MDFIFRKAKSKDIDILFNWVNKKDSLNVKIENKNKIVYEKHKVWFIDRLKDINSYIWIIENLAKKPIGQIRFQKKNDSYFDIDIYFIESERSKGVAFKALELCTNDFHKIPLRAIVKNNNIISYNFFIKSGFLLSSENHSQWVLTKN